MFYPIIQENEKRLPVQLIGIGRQESQEEVYREDKGFPYHQILLVTHGKGKLRAGDQEWSLKAGMCFFLKRGCPHLYVPLEEPFTTRWVCYDGAGADALHEFFELSSFWVGQNKNFYALRFAHEGMLHGEVHQYNAAEYSGKLYQMIVDFAEGREMQSEPAQERLEWARLWVSKWYGQDITLEQMAEQAGMTRFAFCREFRQTYGMTPVNFVNQVRIQQAKRLLIEEREAAVKEIAQQCGFRDSGYFGRVFKQYEGSTPMEFRVIWGKKR